jgi:hypothetical protein
MAHVGGEQVLGLADESAVHASGQVSITVALVATGGCVLYGEGFKGGCNSEAATCECAWPGEHIEGF